MSAKQSLTEQAKLSGGIEKKAPPMKYLLETSDFGVGSFELAKLGEAADLRSMMLTTLANLRRELIATFDGLIERAKEEIRNQDAMFDRLVDETAQAALAAMLRGIDRQELVRQLLESSTVTIEGILAEAKAQIRNGGRSHEEAEEYSLMPGPGFFRKLPPEEKRRRSVESKKRWLERNIAEGKCRSCTRPICRESIDLCSKHLAMKREAQRRRLGTVYAHGRHPNTLKALKEASERRKKTFS